MSVSAVSSPRLQLAAVNIDGRRVGHAAEVGALSGGAVAGVGAVATGVVLDSLIGLTSNRAKTNWGNVLLFAGAFAVGGAALGAALGAGGSAAYQAIHGDA